MKVEDSELVLHVIMGLGFGVFKNYHFARDILNIKSVEYPQIQPFRKSTKDHHAAETMLMMLSANFVLR